MNRAVTLIFLAALTTGLNLYNSLVRFAGAGTLVPITGFANSVVSPAIDFKAEDWPIIDIQSVLWSEYTDLVQNQRFLPTYHLHAFTLNGGCVLFLFSMHFHNTSSAQLILVDGEIFLFWRVVKRGAISTLSVPFWLLVDIVLTNIHWTSAQFLFWARISRRYASLLKRARWILRRFSTRTDMAITWAAVSRSFAFLL